MKRFITHIIHVPGEDREGLSSRSKLTCESKGRRLFWVFTVVGAVRGLSVCVTIWDRAVSHQRRRNFLTSFPDVWYKEKRKR